MTGYRDPDDNPLAIAPLENYTFLTICCGQGWPHCYRGREDEKQLQVF
jgi:hypothetical protein